jgi:hypothetical protein
MPVKKHFLGEKPDVTSQHLFLPKLKRWKQPNQQVSIGFTSLSHL